MSSPDHRASPDYRALLIDAPVGRHFAQLHRDASTLIESVGLFAVTGLKRGDGVVVIATPEHTEMLNHHLWYYDVDGEAARRTGQLVLLDAETTLDRFMLHGMPDWIRFRDTVSAVLLAMQAFGRQTIRAYGEMVDILWRRGERDAAIRLEDYWNQLAQLHPFALFCCYTLDGHTHDSYEGPLHEIGRTHSDVLPTADDQQLREALDAASREIFGAPLAQLKAMTGALEEGGAERLPEGRRAMLWVKRNLPKASADVLARARQYVARMKQERNLRSLAS